MQGREFFSGKALKINTKKASPALSTPPKRPTILQRRVHQESIHSHQNNYKIHHGRGGEVSRSLCRLAGAKTEGSSDR